MFCLRLDSQFRVSQAVKLKPQKFVDRCRLALLTARNINYSNECIMSLRNDIIGAWQLFSYTETPLDGSAAFNPMGLNPKGLIMYTPDGFMSAQFMHPDRAYFAINDFYQGTLEEYKAAGSTYVAYSGPFEVDEQQSIVTHSVFVSLLPNWIGNQQPRLATLIEDVLTLSTAVPIQSKGKLVTSKLIWHRAKAV